MKTNRYIAFLIIFSPLFASTVAGTAKQSLFDRIGGEQKARKIVSDIWDNHSKNPIVKDRFAKSNPEYVKSRVYEIFAAATGAEGATYTGLDMKTAHNGMNISEMEFNAVVDDVLAASKSNGVQQQELNEVLAILSSVRKDIVNSHIITDTLVSEEAAATTYKKKEQSSAASQQPDRDTSYCLKSLDC